MRAILALMLLALLAGSARGAAAPASTSHAALHLAVHDVGISFGNAPRVHGLRLNWRDRGVREVNGIHLSAIGCTGEPGAFYRGIALSFGGSPRFGGAEFDGLGLGLWQIEAERSRGFLIGGGFANVADAVGVQIGVLGLSLVRARGLQLGTAVGYGSLGGITVAALGARAQEMVGINVSGLAVIGDQRLFGFNAAGIGVLAENETAGINVAPMVGAKRVTGLTTGALIIGSEVTGVSAGGIVGRSPWAPGSVPASRVRGIAAGLLMSGDLAGISVAGVNYVPGAQHGVSIAIANKAGELHGVQIGLINIAHNNQGIFRTLPVLNVHL